MLFTFSISPFIWPNPQKDRDYISVPNISTEVARKKM